MQKHSAASRDRASGTAWKGGEEAEFSSGEERTSQILKQVKTGPDGYETAAVLTMTEQEAKRFMRTSGKRQIRFIILTGQLQIRTRSDGYNVLHGQRSGI